MKKRTLQALSLKVGKNYKDSAAAEEVVIQAQRILQNILPNARMGMATDPNTKMLIKPKRIPDSEAKEWGNRLNPTPQVAPDIQDQKGTIAAGAEESSAPPAAKLVTPLDVGHGTVPPVSVSTQQQEAQRQTAVEKLLDTIELDYQGTKVKYSALSEYSIKRNKQPSDKLYQVFTAYQKAMKGEDDKEIREWVNALYLLTLEFYQKHDVDNPGKCAADAVFAFIADAKFSQFAQALCQYH
jgi:hypothetical protein